MESIENQQGVLEFVGGDFCQFGIVQGFHQGGDVVAALHGAQQLHGTLAVDQGRAGFAFHNRGQEGSLHVGGLVHAGRNTVNEQVLDEFFFASRRVFQQFDQLGNLLLVQRLGRHTFGGALFNMFAIGF